MLHYLITNRQILTDANGKEFIEEDGIDTAGEENEIIRFAVFDTDKFQQTKKCKPSITLLPGTELNETILNLKVEDEGDVMCFIHGFHTDLKSVLENVAALETKYIHDNSPIKHIVALTWPAQKSFFHYSDDAKDAESSGATFAKNYDVIVDFLNIITGAIHGKRRNVHLLAHSMGNRMLESMMMHLLKRKDVSLSPLFKEVILAAADADWDLFEDPRAFAKLNEMCERITVYHHEKDMALYVSETTKNKLKRLGKFGFRDIEKITGNVYSVDCTDINDEHCLESKLIQHWYYQDSDHTVHDIIQVFKGKDINDFISESLRSKKTDGLHQYRLNINR
jgi:esterase/lipase superfamily enzyme